MRNLMSRNTVFCNLSDHPHPSFHRNGPAKWPKGNLKQNVPSGFKPPHVIRAFRNADLRKDPWSGLIVQLEPNDQLGARARQASPHGKIDSHGRGHSCSPVNASTPMPQAAQRV